MNILVVRIGRIGDVIMTLPALSEIIKKYPDAHIDVLTSPDGVRAFSLFQDKLSQIFTFRNQLIHRFIDTLTLKKKLLHSSYDAIYCFENKPRYINLVKDKTNQLKIICPNKPKHFSHKCLDLVGHYPCDKPFRSQRFFTVTDDDRLNARLALQQNGINPNETLIALHPTFSGSHQLFKKNNSDRIWGSDNWAKLAQLIHAQYASTGKRVNIFMDLLPNEQHIGREIVHKSQGLIRLLSFPPNFKRYLARIDAIDLLIAPNTGVMHLAAAVNTPTVALFSQFQPWDCGPFIKSSQCRVLQAERYSNQGGLPKIPATDVAQAAIDLLNTHCLETA